LLCLQDLLLRIHQNFVPAVAGVGMTVGVGMFAVAVGMIAVFVERMVVAGIEVVGQVVVVAVWPVVHFPG